MDALNAFVPMDRRQALARGITLPDRTTGAALFADISGFTPLTRALAQEMGRRAGAEELLRQINPVYQALIAELHRYGGSVIGFAGDSITCWLDDALGPAIPRAVACALAMQGAMAQFAHAHTPAGTTITLGIKVAVAAGPARRFLVGDPAIHLIEVLAGRTVERVADAERETAIGEVIVSRELAEFLGNRLAVNQWRGADEAFALVGSLTEAVPATPWPDVPIEALPQDSVRPWILPPVYSCLQAGGAFLGDLRPATPLFLRFSGLDYDEDEQAGQKLDAYVRWVQAVVHRYRGNLIQLTVGDKGAYLYAVFGAPVAHEDDTGRALAAALELQNPPGEWAWLGHVQIGVSRGEVWTGAYGARMRHTYGVIGSEVNLSARLMMAAEPGQTVVSSSIRKHPGFRFDHVGDVACKGFARPIPAYRLLGRNEAQDRFFPHHLVGREAELRQLRDWAQPLASGQFAGAVLIYGEPGIGKSHLSDALRQALGDQVSWFSGQTDQVLRTALNPFVYWFKRYFDQSTEASAEENKARFEYKLGQLVAAHEDDDSCRDVRPSPQASRSALIAELVRTQSVLEALLGLHWPDSLYERLDAKGRHENTLYAVKALLLAESGRRPVVFELEDGHWLDDASQELLSVLTRNVADCPLLLVITSRYADDGSLPAFSLAPGTPTAVVELKALSPDALREQAQGILGGPVHDDLYALLQAGTEANPLFAQQVLYYYLENDLLVQAPDGSWTVKEASFDIPSGIQAILIARIDRLAQQVKSVVQTAAVLGREFEVRVLSQMLREDVLPEVRRAEQEQIWTALHELRYLFKHTLLRDAAYEMQFRARLRELHQLAAEAYQVLYAADPSEHYATLAYHYGQAGDEGRERDYARLAGQQAAARFANLEAVRLFSRALDLTPQEGSPEQLAERYDLLLARERVLDLQGMRQAQEEDLAALEAIARALGDNERRAQVALRRAHYADVTGDFPGAIAAAQAATRLAQAVRNAGIEAEGYLEWGRVLWRQGDYQEARILLERTLALAQVAELPQVAADSLRNLGIVCWYVGDLAGAQTCFEQAMPIYRELGNRQGEGSTLNNLGLVAVGQGNCVAAKGHFERVLDIDRETGDRYKQSLTLGNLAAIAFECGEYDEARASREQALHLCRTIGNRATEAVILGGLSQSHGQAGDYSVSREYAGAVLSIGQELGDRLAQGYAWNYLGHALVGLERLEEAGQAYQEALDIRRALGQDNLAMDSLAGLARVCLARGEPPQAQGYVEEILRFAHGGGLAGTEEPLWVYLTCYQVLEANQDPRARSLLAEAFRVLQERAAHFPDEETRRRFLENVAVHREIVAAWQAARTEIPETRG